MIGTIGKTCTNKNCAHKGIKQPYENFYKNNGYKDGYQSECKSCARERSIANDKKRKSEYNGFFNAFM